MPIELTRFDAADFLRDERDMALYLEAASEENDPVFMLKALNDVARARNMSQLARDAGLTRVGLTKALSAGSNPSFNTVARIAQALGYTLTLSPGRKMGIEQQLASDRGDEPAKTMQPAQSHAVRSAKDAVSTASEDGGVPKRKRPSKSVPSGLLAGRAGRRS